MAVEYVIVAPMILVVLGLIYLFGDYANATGTLEAGTRDAARVASQSRSLSEADQRARAAIVTQLGGSSPTCTRTLAVRITGEFQPGATITVTATCTYPTADFIIGLPGGLHPTATFSSVLDPNRRVS